MANHGQAAVRSARLRERAGHQPNACRLVPAACCMLSVFLFQAHQRNRIDATCSGPFVLSAGNDVVINDPN
jgi:hypothetical protein